MPSITVCGEATPELAPAFRSTARAGPSRADCSVTASRSTCSFDGQLGIDGHGGGIVEPGAIGGYAALLDAEGRLHRRAGIVAEKFSHLPLARQKPQRIAHLRLQAARHRAFARQRLQPRPRGDGRDLQHRVNEGLQ